MASIRRSLVRSLLALLVASLLIPLETLTPDPARVAAAALRPAERPDAPPPASPGTYRSAASAVSTPLTALTIDAPAGLTSGDVMVAGIVTRDEASITTPSGWTLVRSDANGTALRQGVYVRVAGGSEPSTYTWTLGEAVAGAGGGIVAYSGVDTTTPVDVAGGQTNSSSTSVTAPSITTTVTNTQVVGFFATANDGTFSPPSGMTERTDLPIDGTIQAMSSIADVAQAASGASGSKTATASVSAVNIGALVALRPSGTIALRAASSAATVPTTTLTVDTPASVVADDVLVAAIAVRAPRDVSPPAGWSLVRTDTSGTTIRQSVYVRTATGSEPADHTWTFAEPVSAAAGGIIAVEGIDPVSPVDVAGGQTNSSSSSVTAPSVTTTVADATLVGFFAIANDLTFTAPGGMTERYDVLLTATADIAASGATQTLTTPGATGTRVATASSSGTNIGALVALRPADATANLGVGPAHTFESWDLGAGDTLSVNVATRNAVLSHPIISLPIRGGTADVTLVYNSRDRADVGLGEGWRLDVFRRLRINGDDTVTYTDGSGARHTFSDPDTGGDITTWTRPATIYAELERDASADPDRFTLTHRDRSVDEFDVEGTEALLVRSEDRFGNGLSYAYSGTRLTTITDTAADPDRTIDLAWDTGPDRLSTVTDWAYVSGGIVQSSATGSRRVHRFEYDGGTLQGWTDPIASATGCSTPASHRTCLAYSGGLLTEISKTQTITTESSGTLGTTTRTVATEVAYTTALVDSVTDAESEATTFTAESSTVLEVERPTTTTKYGQVGAADAYGRIQSVWRVLGGTDLETRTTFDGTYPVEPATVTANYGALLSTPARTTTYSYVADSPGLLAKIVEPLDGDDDRWTEYTYNANHDLTQEEVSLEGSNAEDERTITRYCYETQALDCSTAEDGLKLVRRIDRFIDSGPTDAETNVVTDYSYDRWGQLTAVTRDNRDPGEAALDAREDRFGYDDQGNTVTEITNYDDGDVDPETSDTTPDPGSGARTDLTTIHTHDTAGNRTSTADPRRAIELSPTAVARDTFTRTVSDDWGTADTGGSWSGETGDFDVAGGVGTISLGSNTNRNAYLTSVSARDVDALVKVRVDRLAVGSDLLAWLYLRRQDSDNHYHARLTFDTTGKLVVSLRETVAGSSSVVDAATSEIFHTTADSYWLRVRMSGTTTLTAKARVWRDGTTEPSAWDLQVVDASPPGALQTTGHVGVRFQAGGSYSGSYPIIASFDGLAVDSLDSGGSGSLGADDYISRTAYDALDQVASMATPTTPGVAIAAQTATTLYDELGAVRSSTDIAGVVSASIHDTLGRPLETWQDTGAPAAELTGLATYDEDGRLLTSMDRRQANDAGFDLGWTAIGYDAIGRQTSVVTGEGSDPDVESETRTTYDGLDRVVATEVGYGSASSQLTEVAYDLGGRAIETNDGFACTTSTFDYRDLPLVVTSALDPACDPATDTREVTNTFDGLGRLLQAEVTDGPDTGDRPTIATYDAVGNTLTAADETASVTTTTTFTSNLLDQVLVEERDDGSTAKTTWDPVGNPTDRCTWESGASVGACLAVGSDPWTNPPTNATSTRWDARNGRIGLTDAESNRTTVYDPAHAYQPVAIYLPTIADQSIEHQTLYDYDARHRLVDIVHRTCTISSGHACASTGATGSVAYEYDDADNRTRVTEANGSASTDFYYCHDALGQLTGRGSTAACDTSNVETFAYDDAGNRTQTVTAGPTTTNFAYTATGLLCDTETGSAANCSGGNVGSDDAGRLSDLAGWHYLYDAQGRLTSACDDADCVGTGFERVDLSYDGEGHRTAISVDDGTNPPLVTTFRYQGDAIVAEYLDGDLIREYVTDDAGTISKVIIPPGEAEDGTYLVTWNGHGDAMALYRMESNGSLTLANSYTYSTWGSPTTATNNGIADLGFRFLYVGAYDVQWDAELGLHYMHARHYSPALGRFLQPDPSRLDAQLFVYAGNGPVSRMDPSGRACIPVGLLALSCIPDGLILLGAAAYAISVAATATYNYLRKHPVTLPSSTVATNAEQGAEFEDREITRLRNSGRWPVIIPRKYFWTPWGARYLDACAYTSWTHYLRAPTYPTICWEFKSSSRALKDYFAGRQYDKDIYLMSRYRFPISVIWINKIP